MFDNIKYYFTHKTKHIKLTPGNNGINCLGNGEKKDIFGRQIDCQCDNCDFAFGCIIPLEELEELHRKLREKYRKEK